MRALLIILLSFLSGFYGFCQPVEVFKDKNTGYVGFKDENGETIIEANTFQRWKWKNDRSEDMILVAKDGKWGYCDLLGNVLIPLIYEGLSHFSDGLALAVDNTGQYGYIDRTGKRVIPFQYNNGRNFQEGLAMVQLGNRSVYIDKKGIIVLEHRYEDASTFKEGFAAVKLNGKWGFINKAGKEICDIKYAKVNDFSEGFAVVMDGGRYSYIDRSGKEMMEPRFDYMHDFKEGLATVKVGRAYTFIDRYGKQIIEPAYEFIENFKEGFARASVGGQYRFIDTKGNTIFGPVSGRLFDFNEGIARVYLTTDLICADKQRCSYINKNGELITAKLSYSIRSNDFHNGFAMVDHCNYGTKGVIDRAGNEIIELKYRSVSFSSGVFTAFDRNRKEFKFDRLGNLISTREATGSYFDDIADVYLFSLIDFNGSNFYDSANLIAVNRYLDDATDLTTLTTYVDELLRTAAKNKRSYQDFSTYLFNKYTDPVPACYKAISRHIALDHLCNSNAPYGGAFWIGKTQLDEICNIIKKVKVVPCD